MQTDGETFRTLGLEIEFPYKGYGVQKSMMNHITRTLMNKENSLIESPTGTGKTLVLLCSTLAWLKKSKKLERPYISPRMLDQIMNERLEFLSNAKCTCGRRANKAEVADAKGCDFKKGKEKQQQPDCDEDSNSCQLLEPSKYFNPDKPEQTNTNTKGDQASDENESPIEIIGEKDGVEIIDLTAEKDDSANKKQKPPCKTCNALTVETEFSKILTERDSLIPNQYKKIPKIFYGTRTHKQVTQVVRELNKSKYNKDLRMCILSSRERTCINPAVKDMPNRDEECRELLKTKSNKGGEGCMYKTDSLEATFDTINDEFTEKAWDIEDVNKWAGIIGVCPYFGCRSLQDNADITFCPYNYLLDTRIRRSLNINLKNSIVIFDEAHNIEDICRESASFMLDTKQIEEILTAINIASSNYVQGSNMADAYQYFRDKFYNLRLSLMNFNFGLQAESQRGSFVARKIFSQSEMMNYLKERDLGPDCLQPMVKNLVTLRGDEGTPQESTLDMNELQYISQLTAALEFMYSDGNKNLDDYRCVVTKSMVVDKPNYKKSKKDRNNPETDVLESNFITQISLLCMSPAIAFKKLHSEAWSVIVASGTLSPIESMQTELGCAFVTPFQGGHVIPRHRVLATVLSRGPNGEDLNCSFTNSLSLKFQDEVGLVVRDVCLTVPNGVLCFFPSYDRLEGLFQRWSSKGYITDIRHAGKTVCREPKNTSAEKFEIELRKYNSAARCSGALLFAVFRGKVSEGIDFADSAARAVITIGIPYPNVKEVTVGLKREYNDIARRTRPHLLPGSDWYASQAFRALNQAVGRCIRHREDWGAIIMIDSRLKSGNDVNSKISKWLRALAFSHNDYRVIKDSLEEFVSARLREGDSGQDKKKVKLEHSNNGES